jgi:hypothetical protein
LERGLLLFAVDLSAMPDVMDYNLSQLFVHGIYDAIIPHTYPVKLLSAGQL